MRAEFRKIGIWRGPGRPESWSAASLCASNKATIVSSWSKRFDTGHTGAKKTVPPLGEIASMNLLSKYQPKIAIAAALVLCVPVVSAVEVDCTTLKDAISASEQDFAAFRGARRELAPDPEMAELQRIEGFSSTRDEYATERRLTATATCSVVVARAEDSESIISEARFNCLWPSTGTSPAQFDQIRKALQDCGIPADVDEDDPDTYSLMIDRVESGEGWGGVSVVVDRQAANVDAGPSVSVIHAFCQAKTLGACEDDD